MAAAAELRRRVNEIHTDAVGRWPRPGRHRDDLSTVAPEKQAIFRDRPPQILFGIADRLIDLIVKCFGPGNQWREVFVVGCAELALGGLVQRDPIDLIETESCVKTARAWHSSRPRSRKRLGRPSGADDARQFRRCVGKMIRQRRGGFFAGGTHNQRIGPCPRARRDYPTLVRLNRDQKRRRFISPWRLEVREPRD